MTQSSVEADLKQLIRVVPNYPKEGINFVDITTLLADGTGLSRAVEQMSRHFEDKAIDLVVGAESRGFIFGVPLALRLKCGFIPVRKPGKLPAETIAREYDLEYGTDKLEIHADAIQPGQRILMVDDLLATGGTMQACCHLVEQLSAEVVGITFLIELAFLKGRDKLSGYDVNAVINYDQL